MDRRSPGRSTWTTILWGRPKPLMDYAASTSRSRANRSAVCSSHVGHQFPEPVDNLPVEFHHWLAPAKSPKEWSPSRTSSSAGRGDPRGPNGHRARERQSPVRRAARRRRGRLRRASRGGRDGSEPSRPPRDARGRRRAATPCSTRNSDRRSRARRSLGRSPGAIEDVREGIHLQRFGGREPVTEFHRQIVEGFGSLMADVRRETAERFRRLRVVDGDRSVIAGLAGRRRRGPTW